MDLLFKYFLFGITLAMSIGPVNIELIKQGVTRGFLTSWLVGIGGLTADFIILTIIYTGFGAFFTSEIVQLLFGAIGSMMLIYIGFQNTGKRMFDQQEKAEGKATANRKVKKSFTAGFVLAIANPINLVFWTGIYSSLLTDSTAAVTAPAALLASIFTGITLSNVILAAMSSMGKSYVKPTILRSITSTSGIVLIGFGCWMGYQTISSKWQIVFHSFFA